jgi:hypothetical protein
MDRSEGLSTGFLPRSRAEEPHRHCLNLKRFCRLLAEGQKACTERFVDRGTLETAGVASAGSLIFSTDVVSAAESSNRSSRLQSGLGAFARVHPSARIPGMAPRRLCRCGRRRRRPRVGVALAEGRYGLKDGLSMMPYGCRKIVRRFDGAWVSVPDEGIRDSRIRSLRSLPNQRQSDAHGSVFRRSSGIE